MNKPNKSDLDALLNPDEVCRKLRFSRSTLYKIRNNPYSGFPKPIDYFSKKLFWVESDLDVWVLKQMRKASKDQQDRALDQSLASLGDEL